MPRSNDPRFAAILALDAYNRDYGAGLKVDGNQIDTAPLDASLSKHSVYSLPHVRCAPSPSKPRPAGVWSPSKLPKRASPQPAWGRVGEGVVQVR